MQMSLIQYMSALYSSRISQQPKRVAMAACGLHPAVFEDVISHLKIIMSVPFSLTRPQGLMRSPLGNASHEALAIHRPLLLLVEACPPFLASEFVQKEMMQIQHISEGNGALFLEIFCYMLPFQETNLELTDKDVVMLKKEHGRALAHGCLKPTLSQAGCPHRPRCPPRLP
jgi:hypothetical protein